MWVKGNTRYRFPIGAATNDLTISEFIGVKAEFTWKQIQNQLQSEGYAAGK